MKSEWYSSAIITMFVQRYIDLLLCLIEILLLHRKAMLAIVSAQYGKEGKIEEEKESKRTNASA